MAKRTLMVSIILLLLSLLVFGCGVPKEEPESVVAERDSLRAELKSVKAEVQSVRSELSAAQSTIKAQEEMMREAKALVEVLSIFMVPVLKNEGPPNMSVMSRGADKVNDIDDAQLIRLFDAAGDARGPGDQVVVDFFVYILETLLEKLE